MREHSLRVSTRPEIQDDLPVPGGPATMIPEKQKKMEISTSKKRQFLCGHYTYNVLHFTSAPWHPLAPISKGTLISKGTFFLLFFCQDCAEITMKHPLPYKKCSQNIKKRIPKDFLNAGRLQLVASNKMAELKNFVKLQLISILTIRTLV